MSVAFSRPNCHLFYSVELAALGTKTPSRLIQAPEVTEIWWTLLTRQHDVNHVCITGLCEGNLLALCEGNLLALCEGNLLALCEGNLLALCEGMCHQCIPSQKAINAEHWYNFCC